MLIPIRDDNPTSRRAYVTLAIIAANFLVFLLWQRPWSSQEDQELFAFCHAEIPYEVTNQTNLAEGGTGAVRAIDRAGLGIPGRDLQLLLQGRIRDRAAPDFHGCRDKSWWQSVFVAMFLHGGWLHIGGNMLFLWVFGNNVEDKIGRIPYLLFYLFSGLVASAAQILVDPGSPVPNLGASGAIAGVLGAYLVMFPRRRVYSLVPIVFIFTLLPLPAIVVLGFWFVLQFFSGVTTVANHVNGGVAYFAHIGGFAAGLILALLFFPKERHRRSAEGGLFP
ncbi:MAG: rhomboid family intramembrane serine protease [Actinomycetota bacterium]